MSAGRVIARLFALLIIFFFVLVLPLLILAYNAQDVATSRGFLVKAIGNTHLYEAAMDEAAAELARGEAWQPETPSPPIARLNAQDWKRILIVVVPQDGLERWMDEAVQQFRGRARFWGSIPEDIVIPYGQMRDNLVQDPQQTALRAVTEAQPPCASGESPLSTPDALLPSCRPATADLEAFYAELSARWQEDPVTVWRQFWPEETGRFAEDTSLASIIQRESGQSLAEVRYEWYWVGWGMTAGRWLWIMAMAAGSVLVLAVVAALAARNWAEVLRWVGAPIFLAGLITVLLGLIILLGVIWSGFWPAPVTELSLAIQEATSEIGRLFANQLFVAMLWQGALIGLIGVVVWLASFLVRKPRPEV